MPSFFFSCLFFFSLRLNVFSCRLSAATQRRACNSKRWSATTGPNFGPTFPQVGLETSDCQQRTGRVHSEPVGTDRRPVLPTLTRVGFQLAEASVLFSRQGLKPKPACWTLLQAVAAPPGAEAACSSQESPVTGTDKCKWKRETCKVVFCLRSSEAVLEI